MFWFIFIFVLSPAAVGALKIPAVTGFMNLVLAYLPNVLVALLIFLVAAALAGAVVGLVHRRWRRPTGRALRAAAPVLVMGIAVFMILNQLEDRRGRS